MKINTNNFIMKDAEMAVDDSWGGSDSGFEAQI